MQFLVALLLLSREVGNFTPPPPPLALDKLPLCRVESAAFVCSLWGLTSESALCLEGK